MTLIKTTKGGRPYFIVRWNDHVDPATGRRTRSEKSFRSLKQARAFEKRTTASTSSASERVTVGQLADAWIDAHTQRGEWAQRTRKDYEEQVRLRVKPILGGTRCSQLTAVQIYQWQNWMLAQARTKGTDPSTGKAVVVPTSPATANKSLRALQTMVRWGRSAGLTECRVTDDARTLPAHPPAPAHPYTPQEVERIAAGCDLLRDATLINLLAYSGLRWSEMCALRWSDIDWDSQHLDLVRALDLDRTTKTPKSGTSRIVPVLRPGMTALTTWRDQAGSDAQALVFQNQLGRPLGSNWYRGDRNLGRIRRASGIHFEPHQLRDTYASILIQSGVGLAELTLWLGHKSIQTTVSRYGKLFQRRQTHLAEKANEFLDSLSG